MVFREYYTRPSAGCVYLTVVQITYTIYTLRGGKRLSDVFTRPVIHTCYTSTDKCLHFITWRRKTAPSCYNNGRDVITTVESVPFIHNTHVNRRNGRAIASSSFDFWSVRELRQSEFQKKKKIKYAYHCLTSENRMESRKFFFGQIEKLCKNGRYSWPVGFSSPISTFTRVNGSVRHIICEQCWCE